MLLAAVAEEVIKGSFALAGIVAAVVVPVVVVRSNKSTRQANESQHGRVDDSLTLLAEEVRFTRHELGVKIDRVSGELSTHLGWHSAQQPGVHVTPGPNTPITLKVESDNGTPELDPQPAHQ